MENVIRWLFVTEIVGLAAFPLTFLVFSRLPDRGYSIAKPFGIALISWVSWMLASFHLIPANEYTLWILLILFVTTNGYLAVRQKWELSLFVRKEIRLILSLEGLFLLFFLSWTLYRLFDPYINTTEKPMDFAFLNSSLIASYFPPEDPWLIGHNINYYYFGYLMMANLTELALVPSRISYNLALSLIASMAAIGALGIAYNLIRVNGSSRRKALSIALMCPVILLCISNMEGILEFLRLRLIGPETMWSWLGIKELSLPETSSWRPTEYMWWWRATRIIDTLAPNGSSLDYTISEFPFFSFLLGDLHPHAMSIPFFILFLSHGFNFLLRPITLSPKWPFGLAIDVLIAAFLLGVIGFVNTWDLIPLTLIWGILIITRMWQQFYESKTKVIIWSVFSLASTHLVMALLFNPYYMNLQNQIYGVGAVGAIATRPVHFVIVWGLFILILSPFLLIQMNNAMRGYRLNSIKPCPNCNLGITQLTETCTNCGATIESRNLYKRIWIIIFLILTPFFLWAAWQAGWSALTWSFDPISVAFHRLLNILPILLLLFAALYSLIYYSRDTTRPSLTFVLSIASVALMLIVIPELWHVDDFFHNRMNTIFKLYYESWVLLAIAVTFCLYYMSVNSGSTNRLCTLIKRGWWFTTAIFIIASLYYPIEASVAKSQGYSGNPTLDGLSYLRDTHSDEYQAIIWLGKNALPGDGILEATGQDYNPEYSRISGSTGLPTILGWPGHEQQWRRNTDPFSDRKRDISLIYNTSDASKALNLLTKYGINYVTIGPRERTSYPNMDVSKFSKIGGKVYSGDNVTIYRLHDD